MRITTAIRITMLALLAATPAAAQGREQDAGAAAQDFLAALNEQRWDAAAGMVLPATTEHLRTQALAMAVATAERHASGGSSFVVISTSATVDTKKLEAVASTELFRFPGARTLGEAAALPPRTFLAGMIESGFSASEDGVRPAAKFEYVGVVVENDSVAHALYRDTGVYRWDRAEAGVMTLHRLNGRWYASPGDMMIRGTPKLAAVFRH